MNDTANEQVRRPSVGLAISSVLALLFVMWILHRLGHDALSAPPVWAPNELRLWVDQRDAVVIAFALVRLVALAFAGYLLLVTALALVARLLRSAVLIGWVELLTLPVARRLLGAVAGVSLSTTTAAVAVAPVAFSRPMTPSLAAPAVAMRRLPEGTQVTMRRLPDDGSGGQDTPEAVATMHVDDGEPAAVMSVERPPPSTWTVKPGDSAWAIAHTVLQGMWGREPTDAEVDPYWRVVVEANRSRLVDPTNPDLIYPSQELVIPPVDGVAEGR